MTEATSPPTSPLDALKPVAGRVLEAALNRALALDPETCEGLRALDGRRITLQLESPPLALQLQVEEGRMKVGPVAPDEGGAEPDLAVRSTLGALLSQLPSLLGSSRAGRGSAERALPVGSMRIAGDADLARRLQRLAERFDPDWQQPFAAVFGDVLGVQIANAIAGGLRQARVLGDNLVESAADYVVEESRDVIGRDELAAFNDDVDALHDDVERLAVRMASLVRRTDAGADA